MTTTDVDLRIAELVLAGVPERIALVVAMAGAPSPDSVIATTGVEHHTAFWLRRDGRTVRLAWTPHGNPDNPRRRRPDEWTVSYVTVHSARRAAAELRWALARTRPMRAPTSDPNNR